MGVHPYLTYVYFIDLTTYTLLHIKKIQNKQLIPNFESPHSYILKENKEEQGKSWKFLYMSIIYSSNVQCSTVIALGMYKKMK